MKNSIFIERIGIVVDSHQQMDYCGVLAHQMAGSMARMESWLTTFGCGPRERWSLICTKGRHVMLLSADSCRDSREN